MSQAIRKQYVEARAEQLTRNEARRIRTRVHDARNSAHDAGVRWPFELLQNALDAGPRAGRTDVTVTLSAADGLVVFQHDGAPFSLQDLAALLSGGSSKDFESEEQTGRFGTGFLVTHVLAERTRLCGIIAAESLYERFTLTLDRGGDEGAILENIRQCERDLDNATTVENIDGEPSARFEYSVDGQSELFQGLTAFRDSLPYLYATRPSLGRVTIRSAENDVQQWTPTDEQSKNIGAGPGVVVERGIELTDAHGHSVATFRVLRFQTAPDARAASLVLLRSDDGHWRFTVPADKCPRVYRDYPIRGSAFVPMNFIFNGKFDVTQERDRISMNNDDKEYMEAAFKSTVLALEYAAAEDWKDRHLLCRVAPTGDSFSRTKEEIEWWNGQLRSTAEAFAVMPVVATRHGYGPITNAGEGGWFADFPLPRLDDASQVDETTLDRLWPLVNETENLYPPLYVFASAWRDIAAGWSALGIELNDISVRKLGEYVREEVSEFAKLKVTTERYEWFARFIDVVGECWKKRGGSDPHVLDHLLPNQHGTLQSPSALKRDEGLSDDLKDIGHALGIDVRQGLLDKSILEAAIAPSLAFLKSAIEQAVPNALSEPQVLQEIIAQLEKALPDGERLPKDGEPIIAGTIQLFDYLWRAKGQDGAAIAKKLPVLTDEGKITRFASEKLLMAPSSTWDTKAQPFVDAYPPSRVLASNYAGDEATKLPSVVPQLVAWGIAVADPLHKEMPAELKDKGLASISQNPEETAHVVVTGESFPQIALLRSAILNRVEVNEEAAKALLGLVLCYIAPKDERWKTFRTVKGRKSAEDVAINVRDSLWISDLRSRNWVVYKNERGESSNVPADRHSLASLLEPKWLENNDPAIQLLSECFDFDALDLRLLGVAPSEVDRKLLRDGLARLVETAGADPSTYDALREELLSKARRQRDVNRCRRIGYAIQEAISEALEARGLHIEVIDYGFDVAVGDPEAIDLDDLTTWLQVGAQLVEIKATRTGEACMTPTQAETAAAESHRYSLCVVDLRDVPEERLDLEWTGADVVPLAKIVNSIGATIKATCALVVLARNQPVGIRNHTVLRYTAKPPVWEVGLSIDSWVAERFPLGE